MELSVANRAGDACKIMGLKIRSVGGKLPRETLAGALSRQRTPVGRPTGVRILGNLAQNQIGVGRCGKDFSRNRARHAAPGQDICHGADRRSTDSAVNEFASG